MKFILSDSVQLYIGLTNLSLFVFVLLRSAIKTWSLLSSSLVRVDHSPELKEYYD